MKQERLYPDDHTSVADTRCELGNALLELYQTNQARTLLVRAGDGFIKTYGADSSQAQRAKVALEPLDVGP